MKFKASLLILFSGSNGLVVMFFEHSYLLWIKTVSIYGHSDTTTVEKV